MIPAQVSVVVVACLSIFIPIIAATSCKMIISQKEFDSRADGSPILTMTKKEDNPHGTGFDDVYAGTLDSNHAMYQFKAHHRKHHEGAFQINVGPTSIDGTDHPRTTILRVTYDDGDSIIAIIPPRVNDQHYNCNITDGAYKSHKIKEVQVYNAKG